MAGKSPAISRFLASRLFRSLLSCAPAILLLLALLALVAAGLQLPASDAAAMAATAILVVMAIILAVIAAIVPSLSSLLREVSALRNRFPIHGADGVEGLEPIALNPTLEPVLDLVVGVNRLIAAAADEHATVFGVKISNRVLAREVQRIWRFLDTLSEGVLIVDSVGNTIFANRAAGPFLELPPDDAPGKAAHEIVQDSGLAQYLHDTDDAYVVRTQSSFDLEDQGTQGRINVTVHHAQGEKGEVLGRMLVFRDVSQIRAAEFMQVDVLSNLLKGMRPRLAGLVKFSEDVLNEGSGNSTTAKLQGKVAQDAKELTEFAEDLLENAQIETGTAVLRTEPVSLGAILASCLTSARASCDEKGIELSSELPERLPMLNIDPRYFEMALNQLLKNAVQNTLRGGTIILDATSHENEFHISVRDTGCGIREDDLERVMDRFFRSGSQQSSLRPGAGIGLNSALGVIRLHGGDIRVSSEEGHGSLFTIVLPRSLVTTASEE